MYASCCCLEPFSLVHGESEWGYSHSPLSLPWQSVFLFSLSSTLSLPSSLFSQVWSHQSLLHLLFFLLRHQHHLQGGKKKERERVKLDAPDSPMNFFSFLQLSSNHPPSSFLCKLLFCLPSLLILFVSTESISHQRTFFSFYTWFQKLQNFQIIRFRRLNI